MFVCVCVCACACACVWENMRMVAMFPDINNNCPVVFVDGNNIDDFKGSG